MKRSVMLTIASLLSILLIMLHVTDDIVRGMDKARPANLIAIAILVVWLYGTLVLTERRPGYIITLIGGIIATVVSVIHLRGTGIVNVVKSSGGFFFLWTLFALGVLGIFSIILSVRGLWNPQWGQSGSRRTRTMDATRPRSSPTPARDRGRMMDIRK